MTLLQRLGNHHSVRIGTIEQRGYNPATCYLFRIPSAPGVINIGCGLNDNSSVPFRESREYSEAVALYQRIIRRGDSVLRLDACPILAGASDPEHDSKLDAERVTLQFSVKSNKRLDCGREPIEDSPLFGGARQQELF